MQILKVGSSGPDVVKLKKKLAAQGFWPLHQMSEKFTPKLTEAVAYFQQTHINLQGLPLVVDGAVGPDTWWALENPKGPAQRSWVPDDRQPFGIGLVRTNLLEVALSQHGVRERPNGSNRGTGVDKYLPAWCKKDDKKGPAWCCFFISWVMKEALGRYPLGRRHGSCKKAWEAAKKKKMTVSLKKWGFNSSMVTPGDAFVMLRRNGTGHIGFVYRVDPVSQMINTIEGNCGNRVKIGTRDIYEPPMRGFINFFGDNILDYEKGLVTAADVKKDGTR